MVEIHWEWSIENKQRQWRLELHSCLVCMRYRDLTYTKQIECYSGGSKWLDLEKIIILGMFYPRLFLFIRVEMNPLST